MAPPAYASRPATDPRLIMLAGSGHQWIDRGGETREDVLSRVLALELLNEELQSISSVWESRYGVGDGTHLGQGDESEDVGV